MLLGVIGIVLILWGLWAGFGTRENNRAQVFQGPVGVFVNFAVIVAGLLMLVFAIF